MVRRPKVERLRTGAPVDEMRCKALVQRRGELFQDRCFRARLRGLLEVLVVLVSGRGPRLWRSAKAPSIADGLVTASVAARKRWEERMETMGGPLAERLDQLDVHVALLFDDGTFDRGATSLIDALVKPRHGVAYEQPSRWRYLLPLATQNAATPSDAYRRLFRDNGLPEESFERRDLRLYRMRMQTVSVDQGSAGSN